MLTISDGFSQSLAVGAKQQKRQRSGGWGYTSGTPYGSMTCAGVCSTAISASELGEMEILGDPSIRKGLDWLAAHFSVSEHPESGEWYYYYLYSLERVGRILDVDFIGEHEWYPEGALQNWPNPHDAHVKLWPISWNRTNHCGTRFPGTLTM